MVCEAIVTAATPGLLSGDSKDDCGEADIMYIGREIEVLGENLL
jgi:hypothetical protein